MLADALAAVAIAGGALIFCAGLGVVGVIASLTLVVIAPWLGIEALIRRMRRRRASSKLSLRRQRAEDSRI
jgi:hypothetical protein